MWKEVFCNQKGVIVLQNLIIRNLVYFVIFFVVLQLFSKFWNFMYNHTLVKRNKKPESVRIGVIIAACNEEKNISATIEQIKVAGIAAEDIYPLLNGCTDRTAEEVEKSGVIPRMIPFRGKGKSIEWWKIFWKTRQSYRKYTHFALGDADTLFDLKFFEVCTKRLQTDPTIKIICGCPKSLKGNWVQSHRAVQYNWGNTIDKPGQAIIGAIFVVPGCANVYSKDAFEILDWDTPDPTPTEDIDVTIQANLRGFKTVFEPNAIVYTQDPPTLKSYVKQLYARWYRGVWMNMRKHKLLTQGDSALQWSCRWMVFEQFITLSSIGYYIIYLLGFRGYISKMFFMNWFFWIMLKNVFFPFWTVLTERRFDLMKYIFHYIFLWFVDFTLFFAAMPYFLKKTTTNEWVSPPREKFGTDVTK